MVNVKTSYKNELLELAAGNAEYAEFNKRIVNTSKKVLGGRMGDLRKMAKRLARDMTDAADVARFIDAVDAEVFEEVMLAGLVADYAKISDTERIACMQRYLQLVDSWALTDCFQRMKKFDRAEWWGFANECLRSEQEFTVRYGAMLLLSNYLDEAKRVFERLRTVKHEGYYVKMGMAWLYAEAAIKAYELTLAEMQNPSLNVWTRRKALTKMLESYRFDVAQKAEIWALREKLV